MYLDQVVKKRLYEKKKILDANRPFSKVILQRLHEQFVIEWTYNSNAIEGNTLTLQETALVLREGITISGKSLREHFEATNHRAAILELENIVRSKKPFTEQMLLKLHKIILSNISEAYAGIYRKENVRILGARLVPPSPLKAPKLMKDFFSWLHKNPERLDIIELSALVHYQFVAIHPFIDGNGRTARLLMNLLLMQKGFPPAIVLKNDRKKYYDTLNKANSGNIRPFILLMAQAIERSLGLYIEAIQPKIKPSDIQKEYISLKEATQYCPYSQEYLSLLARKGKIHAIKKDRNWFTTLETIKKYKP